MLSDIVTALFLAAAAQYVAAVRADLAATHRDRDVLVRIDREAFDAADRIVWAEGAIRRRLDRSVDPP